MSEAQVTRVRSAQDWFADQIADDEPPVLVNQQPVDVDEPDAVDDEPVTAAPAAEKPAATVKVEQDQTATALGTGLMHDLDDEADPAVPEDANSGAKRLLWVAGVGVVVLGVGIAGALAMFGGGPPPPAQPIHRALQPITPAPPASPTAAAPQQDQAVPFTPWSTSCTPTAGSGQTSASRSPLALTDTATDSAWVCGRGPQESLTNGQILHVQFTCSASQPQSACSYELNSLSVTPGWVAKTPGGKDEWLQHRVVRKMQVNFFNGSQPAGEPLFVDTGDAHGPVPATLPAKILASRADIIILYTERAPSGTPAANDPNAPASEAPSAPGGLATTIMGQPDSGSAASNAPAAPTDDGATTAADATFAMSQLEFFGHSPN